MQGCVVGVRRQYGQRLIRMQDTRMPAFEDIVRTLEPVVRNCAIPFGVWTAAELNVASITLEPNIHDTVLPAIGHVHQYHLLVSSRSHHQTYHRAYQNRQFDAIDNLPILFSNQDRIRRL